MMSCFVESVSKKGPRGLDVDEAARSHSDYICIAHVGDACEQRNVGHITAESRR